MKKLWMVLVIIFMSVSLAVGATDVDTDDNGKIDNSFGGTNTGVFTAQMTVYNPDGIQPTEDAIPMLAVESEWAPFGITVLQVGWKIDTATANYSVGFEEWGDPSGVDSVIEDVTTASSVTEYDETASSDPDVAEGSIVYINLDTDDVNYLQVWFTFTIDGS